jgi:excinuclease ABC subunit B
MAFAAEHPIVAHSEFRPVGEIERSEATFEVVSDHSPAGDQPAAIKELEQRLSKGA